MNSELDKILESKTDLDDYLREYGDNSLFLYNYYLQNTSRVLTNYYAYGRYLEIPDKIKLIYTLINNKGDIKVINFLLNDLMNYKLDNKYQLEIRKVLLDLIEMDKNKIINLDDIQCKNDIYQLDPLYFVNKDFNNIRYINYYLDNYTLLEVLRISVDKKYKFTQKDELFLKYQILTNKDTLIFFINNCMYDDYIIATINSYFDGLNNKDAYYIQGRINNKNLREFLVDNLNFDNYDINTVVNDRTIYLMVDEKRDETLKFLTELKKKNFTIDVVLVMDRVDLDYIDKAYNIYGDYLKISPIMNQEHKKVFDTWDMPYYSVDQIKSSEKSIDLYAKTTNDKKDLDGDIKSLSPLEKYVAAYILTTKFAPYKEEDKMYGEYHTSRSVYEFIDKLTDRRIVCVGYVHLLKEFLYRMGLRDTIDWDVHSIDEEERSHIPGDNHARMMIHLVDPKYGIDGIYMSDPTWDEMGLHKMSTKHMLMARSELRSIDPKFSYSDLHLDKVDELEDVFNITNINDMFDKPIPKDTIIKAFLAVEHFLDKHMKMTDTYSDMEYHEMAMKLGLEDRDLDKAPSFDELLRLKRVDLDNYFEIYPGLRLIFISDLRVSLREVFKDNNIDLPNKITTKGINVELDINEPYIKYLEDMGYVIRYNNDKAIVTVYMYNDEPLLSQYQAIIFKLREFQMIIDSLSRENENKGVK